MVHVQICSDSSISEMGDWFLYTDKFWCIVRGFADSNSENNYELNMCKKQESISPVISGWVVALSWMFMCPWNFMHWNPIDGIGRCGLWETRE